MLSLLTLLWLVWLSVNAMAAVVCCDYSSMLRLLPFAMVLPSLLWGSRCRYNCRQELYHCPSRIGRRNVASNERVDSEHKGEQVDKMKGAERREVFPNRVTSKLKIGGQRRLLMQSSVTCVLTLSRTFRNFEASHTTYKSTCRR
jgi:hypothetical protein